MVDFALSVNLYHHVHSPVIFCLFCPLQNKKKKGGGGSLTFLNIKSSTHTIPKLLKLLLVQNYYDIRFFTIYKSLPSRLIDPVNNVGVCSFHSEGIRFPDKM